MHIIYSVPECIQLVVNEGLKLDFKNLHEKPRQQSNFLEDHTPGIGKELQSSQN